MEKVKIYVRAILIPVLIGVLVGLLTSPTEEYAMLQKPPLAPPGFLFPIVWTILYVLMGISYGILKSNQLADQPVDSVYYAQLVVNAFWSIFFFNLGWRLFSFLWILLLIVLVVTMILRFFRRNRVAGLLQIPYLLWLFFAAYLNLSFYLLNR